ncbi:hypothetical protein Tco_0964554 [Tanacetum coccineum]
MLVRLSSPMDIQSLRPGNMMGEIDIDTLTIEQYLLLTQGNQAPSLVKSEFRELMEEDIEDMTIAKYMKYEEEMKKCHTP